MNIIFHILLGLLLAKLFGISSIPSILIGILFSILPDVDHIPYLKRAFRTGRFGVESRSPLHELVGLVIVLSGSLTGEVVCSHLSLLAFSCGLSHFVVDFLTRPCRPLYPFSAKKVDLNLYASGLKEMFIWDAILTIALGMIYVVITIVWTLSGTLVRMVVQHIMQRHNSFSSRVAWVSYFLVILGGGSVCMFVLFSARASYE